MSTSENHAFRIVAQLILPLVVWLKASTAQVATNITSDGTLGTKVTQTSTLYEITGGTRPGDEQNLFHSFGHFDVGTGDTAHFVGQSGIENIIGRVTGGDASMIDGTLQSDANLFLLNPQGIMFGANATLNINGSFHASTADVLRFADGTAFSTHLSANSILTVASPSAFGFLNAKPAGIVIQGSKLEVPEGEILSIVGGGTTIGGDGDPLSGPNLSARGGQVNIISVASSGDVAFDPTSQLTELDVGSFEQLGEIEIVQGMLIDVSGEDGGTVVIRGRHLVIDHSWIFADTQGGGDGSEIGIDIEVDESFVLTQGGLITTGVLDTGDGRDIQVSADSVEISNGAVLGSRVLEGASGNAGDIVVEAEHVNLSDGAQINSITFGLGNGGTVTVRATDVTLEGGHLLTSNGLFLPSGIVTSSERLLGEAGAAGSVKIEAINVNVTNGATINSSALGFGTGGDVTIDAAGSVTLSGTATAVDVSGQSGGSVVIRADHLLVEGSIIFAETHGDIDGVETGLDIDVRSDVTMTQGARFIVGSNGKGNAGDIRVKAQNLRSEDNSIIVAGVFHEGNAGNIWIDVETLILTDGSVIDSSAFEDSTGHAGRVSIMASIVELQSGRIQATTQGEGKAGVIEVETDRLIITEAGQIFSNTSSTGNAGTVMVTASESVHIRGRDGERTSGIFSNSRDGTGDAGSVKVVTSTFELSDGAELQSAATTSGNAGRVEVKADRILLTNEARIGTNNLDGQGGTITLIADVDISIDEGSAILSNTFGSENAGQIIITASVLILNKSLIQTSSEGFGFAGSTDIKVDQIVINESSIESSSFSIAPAGNIYVTTEHMTIMGQGSGLFTEAVRVGGDIDVKTRRLHLREGARISVSSRADFAGTIRIVVQEMTLRDNSLIIATDDRAITPAEGSGGNILIGGAINDNGGITESVERLILDESFIMANTNVGDGANIAIGARSVILDNNSEIVANTNAGVGGNVTLASTVAADGQVLSRAGTIILRDSKITAHAQEGKGGRINIVADAFLADPVSGVDASSQEGGIDGEINIEAAVTNLSNSIALLPQTFVEAQLRSECAKRWREGHVSRFMQSGRAGLPAQPGSLLPSSLIETVQQQAEGVESHGTHVTLSADFPRTRLGLACAQ